MNKKLEEFEERGFFVVEDFFTRQEVERYRELCNDYFSNHLSFPCDGGRVVPGWAGKTPEMEELNTLHEEPRVLDVAEGVLGRPFVFAEHADLHQNKISGWHRDVHDFKRGGGSWPNWTKDFLVIKISFLLQDHTDNGHGLWVDVGSHKEGAPRNTVAILSRPTDLIVFDQRIHHRGQQSQYRKKYNQHRYLITYGYGIDNELTVKHIAGCKGRQDRQRGMMKLPSK